MQRNDTHCTSFIKFSLKWITDLNVKCQVIKLREKNSGESSDDFGYVIDKLYLIKIKNFCPVNTLLKENNKIGKLTLLDLKTYYKAMVVETA